MIQEGLDSRNNFCPLFLQVGECIPSLRADDVVAALAQILQPPLQFKQALTSRRRSSG